MADVLSALIDGKSHAMCAVGHALVDRGHAVLFMPTYSLVQEPLAAKRNLELPRALPKEDQRERRPLTCGKQAFHRTARPILRFARSL